jgi:hypothetical protein
MNQKVAVFRSPKLLASAKDKPCVRCGKNDGTTVAAHLTGVRREAFSGGFGTKVSDLIHARLCQMCHLDMDTLSRNKDLKYDHSEQFLVLCALTLIQLVDEGVLVVAIGSGT